MSDSENFDSSVTWEDFFGTSIEEFMPTLLGMYDTLLLNTKQEHSITTENNNSSPSINNYNQNKTITNTSIATTSSPFHHHQNSKIIDKEQSLLFTQTNGNISSIKCNNIHKFEQNYCDKSSTLNCYNCDIKTKQCDIYKKSNLTSVIVSPNVQRMLSHLDNNHNNINTNNNIYKNNCEIKHQNILPTLLSNRFLKGQMDQTTSHRSPPTIVVDDGYTDTTLVTSKLEHQFNFDKTSTIVQRPLSMSSVVSNTSSSSSSISSTSAFNKCNANNAYLASVESLDDDSDDDDDERHSCAILPREISDECTKSLPFGDVMMSSSTISDDNNSTQDGSISMDISISSTSISKQPHLNNLSPQIISSSLAHRPRYCDPQLNAVERVLLEIIDTEAVYVEDLLEVIQGYLNHWIDNKDCPFSHNLPDLFNNIKDIHKFNENFLEQLQSCGLDPVSIANTFVRNNSGFEVYTQYCTNYPKTMSVLAELMSNETIAKIFRDQQSRLCHSLPLGSYLLKPVQRILKYHLLLQNLMKQCDIKDLNDIELALQTMTGIAKHINDMKRKHEHAVRVQEIQSLLYGWDGEDLTTFGELCAEGTFRMHGAKAKRQAFLFDKMLLLTKNKDDGILSYKTHIMCSNLMLIESVRGDSLSFHVIPFDNPRMQCTLQARNLEQKREWTLQLKRVILENYTAVIPVHARQLVMELGQQKLDDDINSDKTTTKKQYSAPEYLQRRKIDREHRKSDTGLRNKLRRPRKSDVFLTTTDINDTVLNCVKSDDSLNNTPRRNKQRSDSTSRERSKSRDTFVKFGSWRRKSEPAAEITFFTNIDGQNKNNKNTKEQLISPESMLDIRISQYNSKTIPQKIYKLKKARSKLSGSKFYTDLSDTSNCDDVLHISESNDSLNSRIEMNDHRLVEDNTVDSNITLNESIPPSEKKEYVETLEDIVSQLLMQNREFQKVLKKHKVGFRNRINRISSSSTQPTVKSVHTSDSESEIPSISVDDSSGVYETLLHNTDNEKASHFKVQNLNKHKNLDESDYVLLSFNNEYLNNYTNSIQYLKNVTETSSLIDEQTKQVPINSTLIDSKSNISKLIDDSILIKAGTQTKEIKYEQLNNIWKMLNSSKENKTVWYEDTESNPITPEVWLKQQTAYLASPTSKKSGSLPRSFEFTSENNGELKYLTRSGKPLHADRPLTIASDNTNDLDLTEMETLCLPQEINSATSEPSSEGKSDNKTGLKSVDEPIYEVPMNKTTPTLTNSINNLSSVHPEYKIYRPTRNLSSFRNVLNKTSKKIEAVEDDKDKKHATTIVRNYSRSLLQRFKSMISEENTSCDESKEDISCTRLDSTPKDGSETPLNNLDSKNNELELTSKNTSSNLPIYKQGSKSLGARIALSDYANPYDLFADTIPENVLINKCALRPDSLVSFNSHFTSSSDSCNCENSDDIQNEKQLANDCFYEKSFEETENIQDETIFRDSAVYSDQENYENKSDNILYTSNNFVQSTIQISNDLNKRNHKQKNKKLPPPIPVKPDLKKLNLQVQSTPPLVTIVDRLQALKQNSKERDESIQINKSIIGRRKEEFKMILSEKTIKCHNTEPKIHSIHSFQKVSTNNLIEVNKSKIPVVKINFVQPTTNASINCSDNERQSKQIDRCSPTSILKDDDVLISDKVSIHEEITATKGWVKHIVNKFQ